MHASAQLPAAVAGVALWPLPLAAAALSLAMALQ
jgi:hypothetical protein